MAGEEKLREYLKKVAVDLADTRQRLADAETRWHEPVAIVGMACRFPGAENLDAFWELLRDGRSAVAEDVPDARYDLGRQERDLGVYTRHGAFLPDIAGWDAEFFGCLPREALRMDPQQRLLMELTSEAIEDTGIAPARVAGSRTAVVVGFSDVLQYARLTGESQGSGISADPYTGLGSSPSVVAGRLAYHFDLRGPTMTLDTACSSSLVAVHLAAGALRRGECDRALVAGGFLLMHPDMYVNACASQMLSRDGRCKTFDAAADGYVMGEGGGAVMLERLSDAVAAGRRIHAVIRGSAVNQDGRSNGLTAPNRTAQVDVIRRALHAARTGPHEVCYVEAHGSGTPLGDAIEIGALNDVYGSAARTAPLPVGAVKTNIGHLQAAAGMAGLIKTVLVLKHDTVPPNLNLSEPIDAVRSAAALHPVTAALPLAGPGRSPVAGVSSFGWSGTNAHVILQAAGAPDASPPAAPLVDDPERTRRFQVLPVSARTAAAADQAASRLGAHLAARPQSRLADVAFTLQAARRTYAHRRLAVAATVPAATAGLTAAPDGATLARRVETAEGRPVAFLIAGVGEQYPGLVHDLYRREPAFRAALDDCVQRLGPALATLPEVDVADLLTGARGGGPSLAAMLGRGGERDARAAVFERTEVAQPLMFAVNYALATTLIGWGIQPRVMLGYSLGEYVAACLAGVLSLDDALALVAYRAQLISRAAPGMMIAVQLDAEGLRRRFRLDRRGLDIAAVNGPAAVVVAGPPEAGRQLIDDLSRAELACRALDTTHAFHSRMLAGLSEELTAWIAAHVTLHQPARPYLSNVTGGPVDAALVTDPAYWARHMCHPVQFADAAQRLLADADLAVVEIGPGPSLGTLIRAGNCPPDRWPLITATLPSGADPRPADEVLAECLGRLWLAGVDLDWEAYHGGGGAPAVYPGGPPRSVPLPTYPFQRQRYWIELSPATAPAAPEPTGLEEIIRLPRLAEEDWMSVPLWRQVVPPAPADQPGSWLVYARDGAAERVLAALRARRPEATITVVRPGERYERTADGITVRPGCVEDALALVRAVPPARVVHLWTLDAAPGGDAETVRLGVHSLVALARAAGERGLTDWTLDIVTSGSQGVLGSAHARPDAATLSGPALVIPLEYPSVTTRLVDTAPDTEPADVVAELLRPATEPTVALHGGRRWLRSYEPLAPAGADGEAAALRDRGVYLITGGLGGIGLAMAEQLARERRARLVLFGRTGLPPEADWTGIADGTVEADERVRARVIRVCELIALGAEVEIVVGDVADPHDTRRAVDTAVRRFGALHGVLHTAGVPGTGLIQFKSPADSDRVLRPKAGGLRAIVEALRTGTPEAVRPDFVVLFSSLTAVVGGGPGQVDYCAANAYLDRAADQLRAAGLRTVSIAWGYWTWSSWDDGLGGFDERTEAIFRKNRAVYGITFEEGWRTMLRALASGEPQLVVSTQELSTVMRFARRFTVDLVAESGSAEAGGARHPRPELVTPYEEPTGPTQQSIAAVWGEALRLDRVGTADNFFELGGTSLLGIGLLKALRRALPEVDLPPHILYEAPTIAALARFVDSVGAAGEPDGDRDRDRQLRAQLRRDGLRTAAARRGREPVGSVQESTGTEMS